MAAYTGLHILLDAMAAAGTTDMAKVRAAAAAMDSPRSTYPTGFGAKFDKNVPEHARGPDRVQWQGGKQVTVFPVEARSTGTAAQERPRKQ